MILNTLAAIENERLKLLSQNYEFICNKLEQYKQQYGFTNFNSWDKWELNNLKIDCKQYSEQHFYKERYIYSLFAAKNTIDKIKSGYTISDISFVAMLSVPEAQFQLADWWVDAAKNKYPIWAMTEDFAEGYNLAILFWILNSLLPTFHLPILDRVIWELQLQDPKLAINHDCTFEYLLKYRELLQSNCVPVPTAQQQKQEQIYSIPTNLTEEQLKRILKNLKTEGFVAPEQTEEDFLNSFEIEGRKPTNQGKINWIKKSKKSKKDSKQIIPRTVILDFIKLVGKGLFVENKERIIEAVFSIQVRSEEFTRAKSDNYKSEYNTELQQIIAE